MTCVLREGANPNANAQVRNAARCFGISLDIEPGDGRGQPVLFGEGNQLAIGAEEAVTMMSQMSASD